MSCSCSPFHSIRIRIDRTDSAGVYFNPISFHTLDTAPTPTMAFEAKYYHVERATDYFNERPFREGGKRLGSGSFGIVYHAVLHSETGEKFELAIKRLKKVSVFYPEILWY